MPGARNSSKRVVQRMMISDNRGWGGMQYQYRSCQAEASMASRKSKPGLISRPEVIAFLRDIKDNPDDDTPRLILADWLEDRGDPRGRFLRLQAEEARLPWNDPRRDALRDQAELIREEQEGAWLGWLSRAQFTYERGLLHVSVHPRLFLGPTWGALANSETWAWVEGVKLKNWVSRDLVRLADSVLLPSVSSLIFGMNQ